MVRAQQSTKPLSTLDCAAVVVGRACSRLDQLVAESLMRTFEMIVRSEFLDRCAKLSFAERDHLVLYALAQPRSDGARKWLEAAQP